MMPNASGLTVASDGFPPTRATRPPVRAGAVVTGVCSALECSVPARIAIPKPTKRNTFIRISPCIRGYECEPQPNATRLYMTLECSWVHRFILTQESDREYAKPAEMPGRAPRMPSCAVL